MPHALRSWLVAIAAAAFGLGAYQYDNRIKDNATEGSNLKRLLNDFELLVMGPGMGILGYLVMQNIRLKDEAHGRHLEQERRQRFLLLGRIAASMAHEIRNPLQNLRLINEELRVAAPHSVPHWLNRLEVNLRRLDHAVTLAYELARPQNPGEDIDHISLITLVDSRLVDVQEQLGRRPSIHHVRPDQEVIVDGRIAGLGIAIENLLRNAIEATTDGSISITYLSQGDYWILVIRNEGMMPRELLAGEEAVTSLKPSGIGVGVSIARHLARNFGGDLQFQNLEGEVETRLSLMRFEPPPEPRLSPP